MPFAFRQLFVHRVVRGLEKVLGLKHRGVGALSFHQAVVQLRVPLVEQRDGLGQSLVGFAVVRGDDGFGGRNALL